MTHIDWNIAFDLLQSLSIIIASSVAINGINSWRREVRWKSQYELAEEVLSLFYEVQETISIIRSPLIFEKEGRTRKKIENENPKDTEILDRANIVLERFEKNKEPFYKLRALKYRFITVFGKETESPFKDLIKLMNEIITASKILGRIHWKDQGRRKFTEEQFEIHLKEMKKYEDVIWESQNEDNIKAKLDEIISEVEQICSGVLKKK